MAGFRVRVSFVNDEKLHDEKYWMLVNKEEMKLVSDLVKSIEEKFSVNCDKLMLDDARLPDRESIDILQKNDLVKVHVRRKVPIPEVTETEEERRARKLDKKKRKALEKEADIPPVQTVEIPQVSIAADEDNNDENSGPKRKRRRRKHKSQHTSPPAEIQKPPPMLPPPIAFIPPAKGRKHIHFGEDDSANVPEKVFTNGHSKVNNGSPVAAPLNALLSLRSAVFSRNNNNSNNSKEESSIKSPAVSIPLSAPSEKVKQDFTEFPVFSGPPRVGDVVAFKVLELSENYCPEISDYFQGRITEVLPSGDVTIDLIGEGKVKKHSRGKFELIDPKEEEYDEDVEEDEGMLEEEIESTVSYNWSQLIEPRLIT